MPYNNPYNRAIANTLHDVNERYAHLYAYSPVDGGSYAMAGGSNAGVLFQIGNASKRDGEDNIVNDNMELPEVYYYGNDAEDMKGGNGFAESTFRDRGDGSSEGVASGNYLKGGNLFGDIYDGFEDLGGDIGKAVEYLNPFGSGRPEHKAQKAKLLGRMFGKMMKEAHEMKGGMSGGSWWDSLKEGISDVVGFIPDLVIHGLGKKGRGRPKTKMEGCGDRIIGGAILGNPDPYPVKGDSERIAGSGKITKKEREALKSVLEKHEPVKKSRGRPKKQLVGNNPKKQLVGNNGELLAMPAPVALSNGVPPKAQLRGQYGGGKPSVKEAVMKAVEKKLKGGKNLSGMTDKRAEMPLVEGTVVGNGRSKRAEIVKKVMAEKGMKLIEASKYVKEHGLYKP